jgi:hypothetical protein
MGGSPILRCDITDPADPRVIGSFALPEPGPAKLAITSSGFVTASPNGSLAVLDPSACRRTAGFGGSRWLPVAVHAAGSGGAEWRTDVTLSNPGPEEALWLLRVPDSARGSGSAPPEISGRLAPGGIELLADVLGRLGTAGAMPLELLSDEDVVATSFTFDARIGLGDSVAFEEPWECEAFSTETLNFALPPHSPSARLNLGFGPEDARYYEIVAWDRNGTPLFGETVFADGGALTRRNGWEAANGAGGLVSRVSLGSSYCFDRPTSWASIVDDDSGDSTIVRQDEGGGLVPVGSPMLPDATSTSVTILNPTDGITAGGISDPQGNPLVTFELLPGQSRTVADVVGELFPDRRGPEFVRAGGGVVTVVRKWSGGLTTIRPARSIDDDSTTPLGIAVVRAPGERIGLALARAGGTEAILRDDAGSPLGRIGFAGPFWSPDLSNDFGFPLPERFRLELPPGSKAWLTREIPDGDVIFEAGIRPTFVLKEDAGLQGPSEHRVPSRAQKVYQPGSGGQGIALLVDGAVVPPDSGGAVRLADLVGVHHVSHVPFPRESCSRR